MTPDAVSLAVRHAARVLDDPGASVLPLDDLDADELAEARAEARDLAAHRRSCCVCRSPDVAEVAAMYESWMDPARIARAYQLDLDTLRRHAAVFGWERERAANIEQLLVRLAEAVTRRVLPNGLAGATLADLNGITDRIQRGRLYPGGAPRRVARALRAGQQPPPVAVDGAPPAAQVETWEHMVRRTRTTQADGA